MGAPAVYRSPQPVAPETEQDTRSLDRPSGQKEFGPWLSTRSAMAFLGAPTMAATYRWLSRHGIVRRGNGTVSRLDLERELKRRSKRGRSAASRANLVSLRRAVR